MSKRVLIIVGSVTASFNHKHLEALTEEEAKKHIITSVSNGKNTTSVTNVVDNVLKTMSFKPEINVAKKKPILKTNNK
jgi:hypothetical protein